MRVKEESANISQLAKKASDHRTTQTAPNIAPVDSRVPKGSSSFLFFFNVVKIWLPKLPMFDKQHTHQNCLRIVHKENWLKHHNL